jgi:catalase
MQSTVWDETLKLQAADNDYHRRDLYEAIDSGNFPEWELGLQIFDEKFANSLPYDVLDPTKIIPEEVIPVKIVGRLVLDRNPDNFFSETEQVAFCPGNIVPGIDFTEDPLLQGRLFSYLDTQKSRLGTANFHQIPINAPKCPFMNFQRDGMMQTSVFKGRANYEPNSLDLAKEDNGPRESYKYGFKTFNTSPEKQDQGSKLRMRPEKFADHYNQARLFFDSQTENEQTHIVNALIFELSNVKLPHVPARVIANLRNVNEDLAQRVAKGLRLEQVPKSSLTSVPVLNFAPSPKLSIQKNQKNILNGRSIAILIADDTDYGALESLKKSLTSEGAMIKIISTHVNNIKLSNGSSVSADGTIAGAPSQLFDAIAILLSKASTEKVMKDFRAVEWVSNAFNHLKAIGHNMEAKPLLTKANVVEDAGITKLDDSFLKAAAMRFYARESITL